MWGRSKIWIAVAAEERVRERLRKRSASKMDDTIMVVDP